MREPLTINGMTGDSRDFTKYSPLHVQHEDRFVAMRASKTDEQVANAVAETCIQRLAEHEAVRWHNDLEQLMDKADELAKQATLAMRTADKAFDQLASASTAGWAAAHHTWMLTTADVRKLIQQYEDAHARAAEADVPNERVLKAYRECGWHGEEGRTPDRRVDTRLTTFGDDMDRRGKDFEDGVEHKTAVAAQTLRHLSTASG